MVQEIQAKTLLSRVKKPEDWFGVTYNMNIYRGCQHGCIYCDSRSLCYGIEDFSRVQVKINAPDLLRKELSGKRRKAVVGTGAMSDPYIPAEKDYRFTRQALEILARMGFPVHINTKSDLILRDLDMLKEINKTFVSVAFTITTCDDALAARLEPGAPPPSARLEAMGILTEAGIYTGVLMMPVLPFIEDNRNNISDIVNKAVKSGASFIIPWLGMSLRDRQREYYAKLDVLFPGLKQKYEQYYGEKYNCMSREAGDLYRHFQVLCRDNGIVSDMKNVKKYEPLKESVQLSLFD